MLLLYSTQWLIQQRILEQLPGLTSLVTYSSHWTLNSPEPDSIMSSLLFMCLFFYTTSTCLGTWYRSNNYFKKLKNKDRFFFNHNGFLIHYCSAAFYFFFFPGFLSFFLFFKQIFMQQIQIQLLGYPSEIFSIPGAWTRTGITVSSNINCPPSWQPGCENWCGKRDGNFCSSQEVAARDQMQPIRGTAVCRQVSYLSEQLLKSG